MRERYSFWCAAAEMNCAKGHRYEAYQKREKARGLDSLETQLPTFTHIYRYTWHTVYGNYFVTRRRRFFIFQRRKDLDSTYVLTRDIWRHTAVYSTVVESCITQHQCTVGTQGSRVLPVDRKIAVRRGICHLQLSCAAAQLLSKIRHRHTVLSCLVKSAENACRSTRDHKCDKLCDFATILQALIHHSHSTQR